MINQSTLLNFGQCSLVKTISSKLILSKNNVLHTQRIPCPKCGELCSYNGYSHEGKYSFLAKEENAFFKRGQQYCKYCNKTYTVEIEEFDEINQILTDKINNQIKSLSELGNSEGDIQYHINQTEGISVSISYIKQIRNDFFKEVETAFPELDMLEDSDLQGFYGYDEQYLKIDGKRYYRLVFLNLDTDEVIYQELHKSLTKANLEQILRELFGEIIPRGFVFDMKTMYVDAFQNVFGKNIKLQYCIFHLNKAILDKYKKAMSFLKKDLWTLDEVKKMYSIFNIFYDRTYEIEYIIKLQNELNYLSTIFSPKTLKSLEKTLIKRFRKKCHDFKLERIREKRTLKQRTKEEAENILDSLLKLSKTPKYFPKTVVKQLKKVKKNFSCFTGGLEEGILTNNRLEGFFGSTLKKFQKKTFNVLAHFKAYLKLKKMRKHKKSLIKRHPREKYLLAEMFVIAFKQ